MKTIEVWKLIVGATLFIGGCASFSADFAVGVVTVVVGTALIAWWIVGRSRLYRDAVPSAQAIKTPQSGIPFIGSPDRADEARK